MPCEVTVFENYFGLIEMGFSLIAFTAFIIWQKRTLKRDIAARIEREKAQRNLESAQSEKSAGASEKAAK